MSFLRNTTRSLRVPVYRPRTSLNPSTTSTIVSTRHYAHSSYGGGEGDPKGERPQEQGQNPSEHLEHPGPPPPKVNGNSSSSSSSSSSPSSSSNSSNKGGQSDGLDGSGEASQRGPKGGAEPKILDTAPPKKPGQDVDQHNKEFEQRHDRAANKINADGKDNVGKGFWSGQGGADREP